MSDRNILTNQKLKTESHKGRPIEFSIDENGLLGIEFDDYACTYRYMSEAKARELRDWLCKAFPVEPLTAEHAVHDAITRALAEAGIKQEVLIGMCIEVGLEAYRDAFEPAGDRCLSRIFSDRCELAEGHEGPHQTTPQGRALNR